MINVHYPSRILNNIIGIWLLVRFFLFLFQLHTNDYMEDATILYHKFSYTINLMFFRIHCLAFYCLIASFYFIASVSQFLNFRYKTLILIITIWADLLSFSCFFKDYYRDQWLCKFTSDIIIIITSISINSF